MAATLFLCAAGCGMTGWSILPTLGQSWGWVWAPHSTHRYQIPNLACSGCEGGTSSVITLVGICKAWMVRLHFSNLPDYVCPLKLVGFRPIQLAQGWKWLESCDRQRRDPLFWRAVTSIFSQRLLCKMTNSRSVLIARLHVRWTSRLTKKLNTYPRNLLIS